MHGYRRFCNKIWQASKYVLLKLPPDFKRAKELDASKLSLPERWILHRMNTAVREANRALTAREFSKSTQVTYQYVSSLIASIHILHYQKAMQLTVVTDSSTMSFATSSSRTARPC